MFIYAFMLIISIWKNSQDFLDVIVHPLPSKKNCVLTWVYGDDLVDWFEAWSINLEVEWAWRQELP